MRIRIAQIKIVPEKGKLQANFVRLMSVLEEIRESSPDVVITPEGYLDGYVSTKDSVTKESLARYAVDPASSAYTREISDWAKRNHTWFILGCARVDSGRVFNSALIYDRHGNLHGIYNKLHLQGHDHKYCPGTELPTYDSDFGNFGCMICADRRWPETVRTLALKGARVIFNPTYGMHGEMNLCMMRTRSFESEVFIAFTHPQQSLVTGPHGEIVFNDQVEEAGFNVTEIDLAEVENIRAKDSNHLKDRRLDVYIS